MPISRILSENNHSNNFSSKKTIQQQLFLHFQNKLSLICDLCNHQVSQPRSCIECKEIFCYVCLVKYLNQYRGCPICHQQFQITQFRKVQTTQFETIIKFQINQVLQQAHRRNRHQAYQISNYEHQNNHYQQFNNFQRFNPKKQQKCPQHNIAFKYYCQNCTKPICSDCGMMSSAHKDHRFIRLNDIYMKIKQKLNIQFNILTSKIVQSQSYSLKVKQNLQKLEIQHLHIKRYTQQYYLLLLQKFDEQISNKTLSLKQAYQKNMKQIQFYQSCRDSICQQIQKKPAQQLILQSQTLCSSFNMAIPSPAQLACPSQPLVTLSQILPQYNCFNYCLYNYSSLTQAIIYSDGYFLNGIQWRLKIYPRGNGVAKGKYLSVFVEMTKATTNHKKFQYVIQIKDSHNTKTTKREYCSAFDIGECWGYNQFILIQELYNGYLQDDTLSFVMGIRNPDYLSLSKDQSTYIKSLQNEIKLKQRQNQIEQTNIIDEFQPQAISNSQHNRFLKFLQHQRKQRSNTRQRQYQKSQKDQSYSSIDILKQLNFDDPTNNEQNKNIFQNVNQQLFQSNINQKIKHQLIIKQVKQHPRLLEKSKVNLTKIKKQSNFKRRQQDQILQTKQEQNIEYTNFYKYRQKLISEVKQQQFQKIELFEQKQLIPFYLSKQSKQTNKQKSIIKSQPNEQKTRKLIKKPIKTQQKLTNQTFEQKKQQTNKKQQQKLNSALKQKRHLISKKQSLRKYTNPYQSNIEEEEKRQKKISHILEQSKKLEGVADFFNKQLRKKL